MFAALRAHVEFPLPPDFDGDADVAILDSIQDVPQHVKSEIDIGATRSLSGVESKDPIGHGSKVAEMLVGCAPEATFHFYQVMDESGKCSVSDLLMGLDEVRLQSPDILNLSAGTRPSGCDQNCRLCQAITVLVDTHEITVVAAIGNQKNERDDMRVTCPARAAPSIGVGGFLAFCDFGQPTRGTFWDEELNTRVVYCGGHECDGGKFKNSGGRSLLGSPNDRSEEPFIKKSCADNKIEEPYALNADPAFGKPDILGPTQVPDPFKIEKFRLDYGTSYACPFVSAALANIVMKLAAEGKQSNPETLKRLMIKSGKDLDTGGPAPRLSVTQLIQEIEDAY